MSMKKGEIIPLAAIATSLCTETVAIILSYDQLQEDLVVNKIQRFVFMELAGIKQTKTWRQSKENAFSLQIKLKKKKNFFKLPVK